MKKQLNYTKTMFVALVALLALTFTLAVGTPRHNSLAETPVKRVGIIGDSLSNQARKSAIAKINKDPRYQVIYYNAHNGYRIDQQIANAKNAAQTKRLDYMIVELGTNDVAQHKKVTLMERDIKRLLNQVIPYVSCVRWYNVKSRIKTSNLNRYYNSYAPAFNRRLINVLALSKYDKAKLTDYAAWAKAHPGSYIADDVHFTTAGADRFASLALQSANSCYEQTDPVTSP